MSLTPWTTNAALDATAEPYDSATLKYDSATQQYDGVEGTKATPNLTPWTNVAP